MSAALHLGEDPKIALHLGCQENPYNINFWVSECTKMTYTIE